MEWYEFYYPDSGVTQQKVLISFEEYLRIKVLPEDSKKEEKRKGKILEEMTGGNEWFTDKSPLFYAICSGVLECNGIYPCIVKKCNYVSSIS